MTYRSYLLAYSLFLLPGICFVILNYVFLRATGELLTLPQIVERQNESGSTCVYGTALHADTFEYKTEGYVFKKPDVAVIGSSRVMQMKENFFTGSFYNLGGAMESINGGEQLVRTMLRQHKPAVILLGIDFWWFNEAFARMKYQPVRPAPGPRLRVPFLLRPLSFLLQGKITPRQYADALRPASARGGNCTIGIGARFRKDGFGPDGSYRYAQLLSGKDPANADEGFKLTVARIRRGDSRFEYGEHVSAEHLRHFLQLLRYAESEGIRVIPYFPPLAPAVQREIDLHRDRYRYFSELRDGLRQAGVRFYDFENARTLPSADCEFVDGFHGGDVTTARALLAIAEQDSDIRRWIDVPSLRDAIEKNQGRASIPDGRFRADPETDFLKIGCRK